MGRPSPSRAGGRRAARSDGPSTPATVALDRLGVAYTRHPYEHDPATGSYGLEAAAALGVTPGQVFKTLLVETAAGLAVGIVPVDRQLDLKAVAAALGVKGATMADPRQAERATGYVVGGISPVGQRRLLPTVLDETALGFETVFVSGGRRGFDLGLAPADLVTVTRAVTALVGRHP
ncbi:MAG TPA: Cys-tRNA(Pro) deacylase [Intrasporangium sp.]|uniref:Cys-tRNA(Pro) deacylase n=1 Tax=Intrasporangium sp. TaxID=1925024 RepID=UPI002D766458|nr:Cys-tRNA(Pro) deacylase [Intrasporangium sp.]HET7397120.1 Cys-tRNA(Pro) deacylase [Intrasporangium sp.]